MTSPLERALFLLAQSRLLLLELQDIDRQLRRLAARASPESEQRLLDDARDALVETMATGRSARGRIEALVPAIEAEIGNDLRGEGVSSRR